MGSSSPAPAPPAAGTFGAATRATRAASHILSFSDEMRRRGHEPSSRVVERAQRAATGGEEQRLGTTEVFVLRRVREADRRAVALETAVFPAARVAGVLDGELE